MPLTLDSAPDGAPRPLPDQAGSKTNDGNTIKTGNTPGDYALAPSLHIRSPVHIQPAGPDSRRSPTEAHSPTSALERGKACVECRRRKQKCDGESPTCGVCARTNRPCRFEKPVTRPVAIVLQERLSHLEEKLTNLKLQRSAPVDAASRASQGLFMPVPPQMTGKWWELPVLAPAVHDYLFELFITHSCRVHCYFHIPSFRQRMQTDDETERPHPCLLNAIYLTACYFSSMDYANATSFARQEAHFLSQAQAALSESLSLSDRLLDFIRGSNLVTFYLYNRGRFLEGYHVHCGNARFALSCGLHRIARHDLQNEDLTSRVCLLPPPTTILENGERILAFWTIYWLDRLGSLLMKFVPALPTLSSWTKLFKLSGEVEDLCCTLPRDVNDYAAANVMDAESQSLNETLRDPSPLHPDGDTYFTLFLKAMAGLYGAARFGELHRLSLRNATGIIALRLLHDAVDRFADALPPVTPTGEAENWAMDETIGPMDRIMRLEIRTITLASILVMNDATADVDSGAYSARLKTAGYISALVFHLGNTDVGEVCLVTAFCWYLAADVLLKHLQHEHLSDSVLTSYVASRIECESQLTRLMIALEQIVGLFPVMMERVKDLRSTLDDIWPKSPSKRVGVYPIQIRLDG